MEKNKKYFLHVWFGVHNIRYKQLVVQRRNIEGFDEKSEKIYIFTLEVLGTTCIRKKGKQKFNMYLTWKV